MNPADQFDDLSALVKLYDLYEGEADGDGQGSRGVEDRTSFHSVLFIVLQQGTDQSLLRRTVYRPEIKMLNINIFKIKTKSFIFMLTSNSV